MNGRLRGARMSMERTLTPQVGGIVTEKAAEVEKQRVNQRWEQHMLMRTSQEGFLIFHVSQISPTPTPPLSPPGTKKCLRSQATKRWMEREKERTSERFKKWEHAHTVVWVRACIPSEDRSNTTPGRLFWNTYRNVCSEAEAQTLCDDSDISTVVFAVYSASDCMLPLKGLFTHRFIHRMIFFRLYDTQNFWLLFKGQVQHLGRHPCWALDERIKNSHICKYEATASKWHRDRKTGEKTF